MRNLNETKFPTPEEVEAYIAKGRRLRSQAMWDVVGMLNKSVSRAATRETVEQSVRTADAAG